MDNAMRYHIRRRAQLLQKIREHLARLDIAAGMVLTPDARRSIATCGVIYGELDGGAAAVEGQDDHEPCMRNARSGVVTSRCSVVTIFPYKTMG
jgi:hypothetical protein